mgnify:CR=1 FL=1
MSNVKEGVKMKNNKWNGVQHGELIILPVGRIPKNGKVEKHKSFIVGHSESGHHHVLESTVDFDVVFKDLEVYLQFNGDTRLVHKKAANRHETKVIPAGSVGKVYRKTLYDPFKKIIREVRD